MKLNLKSPELDEKHSNATFMRHTLVLMQRIVIIRFKQSRKNDKLTYVIDLKLSEISVQYVIKMVLI